MTKNNKGFTLIELLVVIAIIGLLSTLAVIALGNARLKARDARRLSDIKQIQTALELYMNDQSEYPASTSVVSGDPICVISGTTGCDPTATFMQTMPFDPSDGDQSGTPAYMYTVRETGNTSYTISYTLESSSGGLVKGTHCATPAGITLDATTATACN